MRGLSGLKRTSIVAVFIASAVGCSSDDDKSKGEPDSSQNLPGDDAGSSSTLDSGMDGSLVGHDATVLADGKVIDEPPTADSGQISGPDAGNDGMVCPDGCNDNVDCTIDRCVSGACQHRVDNDFCAAGSSCSVTAGCQQGKPCMINADCTDSDACTVNAICNKMHCEYHVLDHDGDGYPPKSCAGGADCDDNDGLISPSQRERCDGIDNDCDGNVDEDLTLPPGEVCTMGEIHCGAGWTECNGTCVNTNSDPHNCGGCATLQNRNFDCGSGGVCTNGGCGCTTSATVMMCGGTYERCANLSESELNCGTCGNTCGAIGPQWTACIDGACTGCGGESQVCCDTGGSDRLTGCALGLTCMGTPGTAASKCSCAAGSVKCGSACVDIKTSRQNCGACGTVCRADEVCATEGETTACTSCGGLRELCCDVVGFEVCGGGLACGPDHTCVLAGTGQAGANGPGQ